jgi:hypothetical protein
MASIRKTLLIVAVAAAFTLGAAVTEAGLMGPKADVVRGTIASYDSQTGRLVVGSRTLYLTPQSAVQKRVRDHYEPWSAAQFAPGQEVRAVVGWINKRYVVRSVDVLEKDTRPQAK